MPKFVKLQIRNQLKKKSGNRCNFWCASWNFGSHAVELNKYLSSIKPKILVLNGIS
jgi:hypothetical protein